MTIGRWQDWVILALGAWLLLSPLVLGHAQTVAGSNAHVTGIAIALFALLALTEPRVWEEWVNLALGAWLVVSPFVLDYTQVPAATWNHMLVGLLVGADALLVIMRPGVSARAAR